MSILTAQNVVYFSYLREVNYKQYLRLRRKVKRKKRLFTKKQSL